MEEIQMLVNSVRVPLIPATEKLHGCLQRKSGGDRARVYSPLNNLYLVAQALAMIETNEIISLKLVSLSPIELHFQHINHVVCSSIELYGKL